MLTKKDLQQIAQLLKPLHGEISSVKSDLSSVKSDIQAMKAHNLRIENKLLEMEEKFDKNLFNWKSELFDKIDPIIKRVVTAEQENVILQARESARNEIKVELDARLKKLERQVSSR